MVATAALMFKATLAGLAAAAVKTILLQPAAQALPAKEMLVAAMVVLLTTHIRLVAAAALAQQARLRQVIPWPGAAALGFLPQSPGQRYFTQAVAVVGYIILAEPLALAEVEAGEMDHQILPLGVPERQTRAAVVAGLEIVLQVEQVGLAL
jgi:hypothetical protein